MSTGAAPALTTVLAGVPALLLALAVTAWAVLAVALIGVVSVLMAAVNAVGSVHVARRHPARPTR